MLSAFVATATFVLGLLTPGLARAIDSAEQVCGPSADPCNITTSVTVDDGATLDFGLRSLVIGAGGQLVVGQGVVSLLAGSVTIGGNGIDASGGDFAGVVDVQARRACADDAAAPCLVDDDCTTGVCSDSGGDITTTATINASAQEEGGQIALRAAGSITIGGTLNTQGQRRFSDAGFVTMIARGGAVLVNASIQMSGGGQGTGGDLLLSAETEIVLDGDVDASGGAGGGGAVEFDAGTDVTIRQTILAHAATSDGFGGGVDVLAERDIRVLGSSAGDPTLLRVDGSGAQGFGGDGGEVALDAGRDVILGPFARIEGTGASPDGFGGEAFLAAGRNLLSDIEFDLRGVGSEGGGGVIDVSVIGDADFTGGTRWRLSGGEFDAGEADALVDGNMSFAGELDLTASSDGSGGNFSFATEGTLIFSGTALANGSLSTFDIEACIFEVTATGFLDNRSEFGDIDIAVGQALIVQTGGRIISDETGDNDFSYGDANRPPELLGTVTPAPTLTLELAQTICPVCGNGALNFGESCDDGNLVDDDGCSADCQIEGCVDETPGFPDVPLCDDGDPCTLDACNADTESCDHSPLCEDGVDCTVDICVDGACTNRPDDGLCEDGVFCNGAEQCDSIFDCQPVAPVDCDDFVGCTTDTCDEDADQCVNELRPGCSVTSTTLAPFLCGDANGDRRVSTTDALVILKAAVGGAQCDILVCDVNVSGTVNTTDALSVLKFAVGAPVDLVCSFQVRLAR